LTFLWLVVTTTRLNICLPFLERGKGRTHILSRKFYEFVGKAGAYTRRKGLDREHNLALLKKHIDENSAVGSKLDELCQVIPSLPRTHVQSLLQTLSGGDSLTRSGNDELVSGIRGKIPKSRWNPTGMKTREES
jgi:ATP-dependent DNA helicase RecG